MSGLSDAADSFDLVAQYIRDHKVILCLGSAVHAPAPPTSPYAYTPSDGPPLGGGLSKELAAEVDYLAVFPSGNTADLQRVSLYYETKRSRSQLVSAVRARIQTGKKPSPVVRALAALDFPLVVTTNYDQLFEQALRRRDKTPLVSVYDPTASSPTVDYLEDPPNPQRPFLCKIHGDIEAPQSLVITDEDYIQFVLRMSDKPPYDPIPDTLRYYLKKWPTLFIGYSLLDYNLRLLFKTLRWRLDKANFPDMYSVDRDPDWLILEVWANQRRYVKFIVQDVWTFVPSLYQAVTGQTMPND